MYLKIIIITLLLVDYLSANCDVCLSGKAACHSENTYSLCAENVPKDILTCPEGLVCTGEKYFCYPKAEGYEPVCKSSDSDKVSSSTALAPTTTSATTTTATATTTAAATTPVATTTTTSGDLCATNGGLDHANVNDPTCKTFIECIEGEGIVTACAKINKKDAFYNGVQCSTTKPDHCI